MALRARGEVGGGTKKLHGLVVIQMQGTASRVGADDGGFPSRLEGLGEEPVRLPEALFVLLEGVDQFILMGIREGMSESGDISTVLPEA